MDITKKHSKYIKVSNMTSPKNIAQKYKDEQHGHHQKT